LTIKSILEPFDRDDVFCNLATWEMMFADGLMDNPDVADSLAWLLCEIIRESENSKKARPRIVNTLKLGLEFVYPYTHAGRLSYEAYLYCVSGLLAPGDVLQDILKSVISRAESAPQQAD